MESGHFPPKHDFGPFDDGLQFLLIQFGLVIAVKRLARVNPEVSGAEIPGV